MRIKHLKTKTLVAALLAFLSITAACAATITVSAAASLTNAFKDVAESYEAQFPGVKVNLNFGASGVLLQQMVKGAPVDVFASADQKTMDMAEQEGLIAAGSRHDFVRNTLVLIVPADSTISLKQLEDLGKSEIKRIAIANPASVPVGRYTKEALEKSGLWMMATAKSINTQNVRQSLDYVARGEVDTGFVYATDAALMRDKVSVVLDVPLDTAISYPIAITRESGSGRDAGRFVDFILSSAGQQILAKYGFREP